MPGVQIASWRVLPAFIVRPSGFAFARLLPLRFERSVAAARELALATQRRTAAGAALDGALSQERYRGNDAFDDPVVRKQLSRHVKRARAFARGESAELPAESLAETARVVPTAAALVEDLRDQHARLAEASRALEAAFAGELDERRAVLRAAYASDDRLREAVFLESPEAFERVQQLVASAGPRDARARQRERVAIMYLQRFCAKNDTNSMCGPHGVAWVLDHAVAPRIAIEPAPELRRSYFSHWAATRVLARAVELAGPEVVAVRINPTVRLAGDAVSWCTMEHDATTAFHRRYARARLPGPAAQLVGLVAQRPRPLAELVRLAVAEHAAAADDVTAMVAELCEVGILIHRPSLPPGLFDPLDAVIATLERWPDGEPRQWGQAKARELQALTGAFGEARLPDRVTVYHQMVDRYREVTGDTAERGHGRHYADRTIVHEDCHAAIRAEVGAETLDPLLAALVPLVHAASLPLELARESVAQWFREQFGEGRRVAVLDAHRAFDEQRPTEREAHTPAADAIRAGIARVRACFDAALAAAGGGPVRVPSAALAAALDGTPADRPGYVSADVMLCRRPAARPELVLGEVHGFFWLPTCLLDVVPDPDRARVVDHMRGAMRALAGGRPTVECLFAHNQATDRRYPLTDADLLLIDASDRPSVGLGALDMVLDGGGFRFLDGEREVVPVTAYTTYPFFLYTSPLAPLVDDFAGRFFPEALLPAAVRSGDAPRMQVDGLTFRRRTWQRPVAELQAVLGGKDAALLFHAQQLRERLACPPVVFASLRNEPKPVLVDFDNFFLVESFAHLVARQAADAPDAAVRISEMLPGPDELFATAADGARTSELRMGFYRLGARATSSTTA